MVTHKFELIIYLDIEDTSEASDLEQRLHAFDLETVTLYLQMEGSALIAKATSKFPCVTDNTMQVIKEGVLDGNSPN